MANLYEEFIPLDLSNHTRYGDETRAEYHAFHPKQGTNVCKAL